MDKEPIPAKEQTPEQLAEAREIFNKLNEDTEVNRQRKKLMADFLDNHPAMQSIKAKFGKPGRFSHD